METKESYGQLRLNDSPLTKILEDYKREHPSQSEPADPTPVVKDEVLK